jgi:hypothetical protein
VRVVTQACQVPPCLALPRLAYSAPQRSQPAPRWHSSALHVQGVKQLIRLLEVQSQVPCLRFSLPAPRASTTTETLDTFTESRLRIPAFGADEVGVTGLGVVPAPPSRPPKPAADAMPSTSHALRLLSARPVERLRVHSGDDLGGVRRSGLWASKGGTRPLRSSIRHRAWTRQQSLRCRDVDARAPRSWVWVSRLS